MIALLDADIICYEFGNMRDLETTELLAWPIVRKFVDDRITQIVNDVDAAELELYLTGANNFRKNAATILPYKGHRPEDKPPHWQNIRDHLIENYDAKVVHGMEADDAVGIRQSETIQGDRAVSHTQVETIICSRDKDLHMIPGWHYQWECGKQAMRKWFVNDLEAIQFFYKQLLTGDATDNILGLFGVGSKAASVKAIDNTTDEYEMFTVVADAYESRFGGWYYDAMLENAVLLWIMRDGRYTELDLHQEEITDRLREFIKRRNHEETFSKESCDEASIQDEGREE